MNRTTVKVLACVALVACNPAQQTPPAADVAGTAAGPSAVLPAAAAPAGLVSARD